MQELYPVSSYTHSITSVLSQFLLKMCDCFCFIAGKITPGVVVRVISSVYTSVISIEHISYT